MSSKEIKEVEAYDIVLINKKKEVEDLRREYIQAKLELSILIAKGCI